MQLQQFNHEVFGELQVIKEESKFYFPAAEAATLLGYKNPRSALNRHCLEEGQKLFNVETPGGMQEKKFITEGNLYRLITKSKLPAAVAFEKWVFDDLLPTIREKGGAVVNIPKFTDHFFPNASLETKQMLATVLHSVQEQNAIIAAQQHELAVQNKNIQINQEIITSLTEDVELIDKRQLLSQIILKAGVSNAQKRWQALYRHFENVYHVRLDHRFEKYNQENSPKMKNKLDYIDKVMDRLDDLYVIAVKLYESDVEKIQKEIIELRQVDPQMTFEFEEVH